MAQDNSRLSRLTSIMTILQSKRVVTATELSKRFDVSIRTIYRDIRSLESSGVPIFTEEGKGYSLVEGYNLPPIMFSEDEANALITAFKMVSNNKDGSLVKNYQDAITKIKAVLKPHQKENAELLTNRIAIVQNYNRKITSNILTTVQKGITALSVLEIKYRSLYKDQMSLREIEPQALYHTNENWILIAWCRLRNDFREFRLDRIETVKVKDLHFKKRPFDLYEYFLAQAKKNSLNP